MKKIMNYEELSSIVYGQDVEYEVLDDKAYQADIGAGYVVREVETGKVFFIINESGGSWLDNGGLDYEQETFPVHEVTIGQKTIDYYTSVGKFRIKQEIE